MKLIISGFFALCAAIVPHVVFAHEVYVLPEETIATLQTTPRFSFLEVLFNNLESFQFWAFIGVIVVVVVFVVSTAKQTEMYFAPLLQKLPRYAPLAGRITISLALFASAYYGALFGPELPLIELFGYFTPAAQVLFAIFGLMLLFGYRTRVAAFSMLFVFAYAILIHGQYMFTYSNYFGEFLLISILGAHVWAIHHREHDKIHMPVVFQHMKDILAPFAFLFLRIAFGLSLIYASVWAKIIHNNLALAVASQPLAGHATSLAMVLGFEPHFLVLGAAIVEITIGLFFIFGIEIRFTSLFLLFWLSLSLWYFGEAVWPHLILIGIPISFILYGYDKYSLEGYFFKKNGLEPVL